MGEKDREELLLALAQKYKHQPSSTFVVKPAVTHKVKQKAIPKIDVSKRRDPNATISQDNRDRDYVAQQRAQRQWDATIAKAKSDYAMDNALLKTSNIQPINGQYSPEVGDFAGWETVGAIAGGTDPLNFVPFGKITRGIKARRLAKTIDAVVDDGLVGSTKEMPFVRPEDVVNPEHFRYAHNNNPSQPKLETLQPKLDVNQQEVSIVPLQLPQQARLNIPEQNAGLFEYDEPGQFGRILNWLDPKKYNFVDDAGNVNMRHVAKAVKEYYKNNPSSADYKNIYNSSGNLYEHIRDVVKSAQQIPVPKGYTRKQLVESALYHDIGKVLDFSSSHGHTSVEILDNLSQLGRIDLDPNVRKAVYDHMSHHMLNKDDLTKALHFADVARGASWDDASFKYRHLSYNWDKPSLNIPKIPFREELKHRINPWLKNKGYETIPLNISEGDAWAQLEERIDQHRSFLRGARDPLKTDGFDYHGTNEKDAVRNVENVVNELQKIYGITREQALSPQFAKARTQLGITNVPLTPTGYGRRSHLFGDYTDKNGLAQYTGTSYSKMLGVDKNKQDALYISNSDDVASNYASSDRYGEADVVALPREERRPGESMSEYLLRNDYEMIDLDRLEGQRYGSGAIYEDPYRLQTGRSLMSDMKKEGRIRPPVKRNYNNIIFPIDDIIKGFQKNSWESYSNLSNLMDEANATLQQNGIGFRFNRTPNNGIVSPTSTFNAANAIQEINSLQRALSHKQLAYKYSRDENAYRMHADRNADDFYSPMFNGESDFTLSTDNIFPPDDLFVDAFQGDTHVHNAVKRQKINTLPFPNVKQDIQHIANLIGIRPNELVTGKQHEAIFKAFLNPSSDPNKYFPTKYILNKIIDHYTKGLKGRHFSSYTVDWKNAKPTPQQMADFMREKGVVPRYEIEGYGDNNVFLIQGDTKNKTKNKGNIRGAYGYVVGKKGEKRLEIKRPIKTKEDVFTGFGNKKDQGKYNKELKITRKTLR